jgi:hypothetical protein
LIGICGARVVVVDDDESEALPIIKAFARRQIPAAFFDGGRRGLPRKNDRLKGVRLAVLDMDVVGGGVPDATKLAALAKLVASILSPYNGPYVVLAWTKHPELSQQFEDYLFRIAGFPRPVLTVTLEKAACKTANDKFDIACITRRIEQALEDVHPFMLLQAWEGRAFDAATDVTNALSEIAAAGAADYAAWRRAWRTQLLQLMYALASAVAEQNLDNDSCLAAFYEALNPLHADRLESNSMELATRFAPHAADILAARGDPGIEKLAKMNTMLHIAFDNLQSSSAGNIYRFLSGHKPKWVPSASDLLNDLLEPLQQEERMRQRKDEVLAVSLPLLVEVSPICDHAQRNVRIPRFVAGVVIPIVHANTLKKSGGFNWRFGPIYLDRPLMAPGQYYIVLSARHLVTHVLTTSDSFRPSARLRSEALNDLFAWLFHHASRPGITVLRPHR